MVEVIGVMLPPGSARALANGQGRGGELSRTNERDSRGGSDACWPGQERQRFKAVPHAGLQFIAVIINLLTKVAILIHPRRVFSTRTSAGS